MIIYFSATGNSQYVANQLAGAFGEKSVSILEIEKIDVKDENLGFVFPTYFLGLPSIVDDFFKNIKITAENSYVYFIATYGTTTGQTHTFVKNHLKNNDIKLDAAFSVKMPDTWTPTFDLSNKDKVKLKNQKEISQINIIIEHVKNKDAGNYMKAKIPMVAVKIYKPLYEKARKTSHLNLIDSCIGCGLCEKNCPIKAIEITDKKPLWIKEKCVMCLSCLHHCPKFAIHYGNKTINHGQYHHPKSLE